MSNIKIFVFCTFLFISLFACDTKTDIQLETSREVKQSNPNVDTDSTPTEKKEILLYKGVSNWALPCLNRQITVLGMDVVNKRIIRFYIENISPIAIPTTALRTLELRPFKNGVPIMIRSSVAVFINDGDTITELTPFDYLYPSEQAVVAHVLQTDFTSCSYYALAYDGFQCKLNDAVYTKLSNIVDCTNVIRR